MLVAAGITTFIAGRDHPKLTLTVFLLDLARAHRLLLDLRALESFDVTFAEVAELMPDDARAALARGEFNVEFYPYRYTPGANDFRPVLAQVEASGRIWCLDRAGVLGVERESAP